MHDRETQTAPAATAAAPTREATGNVHALVAHTGGNPAKLAALLANAPAQHEAIMAEAHKQFGNAVVQRALAEPRPAATAAKHENKVEAGKAPVAEAARIPVDGGGGGSSVSYSSSQSTEFTSGDVHISETVICSVQHGDGAVNFDLDGGHLEIGSEKMNLDLKSANAATGKGLEVTGASVTVAHNNTSKSSAKLEDGYVGIEYETVYTVKGHAGWTAKLTMRTFAGVKPPHHHKHWWQEIPILSVVTAAVISAVVAAGAAIIATSPEWGPVVVLAL